MPRHWKHGESGNQGPTVKNSHTVLCGCNGRRQSAPRRSKRSANAPPPRNASSPEPQNTGAHAGIAQPATELSAEEENIGGWDQD